MTFFSIWHIILDQIAHTIIASDSHWKVRHLTQAHKKTSSPRFYTFKCMQMYYLAMDESNVEIRRHVVEPLLGPQPLGTKLFNGKGILSHYP